MSNGLQVFSASGAVLLDTVDGVARLIGEYSVPAMTAGQNTFVSVAGMDTNGWHAFQVSSVMGLLAKIESGGFRVYSGFISVGVTGWIVMRSSGASTNSGFGFSVSNASSGVQIDQDYDNYVRLAAGTGVASNTAIPTVTGASVYAVRPSSVGATISKNYAGRPVVSAGTYDWVAYGRQGVVALSASGFGLRVFRADGSPAYDSGSSLLRPINSILVPTNASAYSFTLTQGPAGMRPYVSFFNLAPTQLATQGGNTSIVVGPRVTFGSHTSISCKCDAVSADGPPVDSGPWVDAASLQFFVDY